MTQGTADMLLAIDPGIRGAGLALFNSEPVQAFRAYGELQFARYVRSPCSKGNRASEVRDVVLAVQHALLARNVMPHMIRRVAVEWPQNYNAGQQKGDQNDLLPLAAVSAGVTCMFPLAEVTSFVPREWKATMRDYVCASRVLAALSVVERGRFDDLGRLVAAVDECKRTATDLKKRSILAHNTCDAVGIGLKALGRFEPHHVIAR